MKYYLIEVEGGVEAAVQGPDDIEGVRDGAACRVHNAQEDNDSLFWADVDDSGVLTAGSYAARFFLKESADSGS